MMCAPNRQRGFSLVIALFLLVVMATLGVFLYRVSSYQQATVIFSMLGARAYQAAQTGIEWGGYQAINNTAATCGAAPSTPTTNTFSLTGGALAGFSVSVTCEYTSHQEGAATYNVYVLTSRATSGTFGTAEYVTRTVRASVTDAP